MPAPVSIPARRGWSVVSLLIGVGLDYLLFRCHAQIAAFGLIILSILAVVFTLAPLYQLIRPRAFATFTDRGLAFPILNIHEIPWSRILDAQVGPKTRAQGGQTTIYLRRPLVLKLAAATVPAPLLGRGSTEATEAEVTEQRLIDMAYSPISTEEFIARLGRWHPVASARHLAEPTNAFTRTPEINRRTRRAAVFLVLFGIIFMSVGGCVGLQTVREREWPTTSGTVLSSAMTSTTSTKGTTYSPAIVYRYQVAGHDYTGRRYAMSHASSADAVRAILARYPAGAATTVFYNPAEPSSAVLAQSPITFPLVFLIVGSLALCAGVLLRRKT